MRSIRRIDLELAERGDDAYARADELAKRGDPCGSHRAYVTAAAAYAKAGAHHWADVMAENARKQLQRCGRSRANVRRDPSNKRPRAALRDRAANERPWRVRDRLTRARYYFDTRAQAIAFVDSVSTSDITGEPLRQWRDRLVVETNKR